MAKLTTDRRRVLEILAGSPDGCTESLLMAHGVSHTLIAELIIDGYASAHSGRMSAGGKKADVRRFRITAQGLQALQLA